MLDLIKYCLILLLYSAGCVSLGALVIHVLLRWKNKEKDYSALALAGTSFILGQGLLANLWILLAVVSWFQTWLVWACVLVSILAGGRLFIRYIPGAWKSIRFTLSEIRRDTWGWRVTFGSVVFLAVSGVTTVGRAIVWDAINFYYFLPHVIAYSGYFPFFANKGYYNYMGVLGEMNFAALISMGMGDKARLFSWVLGLAGALFVGLLCKKLGLGRRGLIIAWAMFFTSSSIVYVMGDGKSDLFPLASGIAAVYWVLQIEGKTNLLEIGLTGVLAGYAIISKLVYLPPLFLICALVVLQPWIQNRSWKEAGDRKRMISSLLVTVVIAAAGVALVFIPNWIKNYAQVGTLFPVNPEVTKIFMDWDAGLGMAVSQHEYISYPLFLAFGENRAGQLGDISPLLFAFLPLAVFLPRPRSWLASRMTFLAAGSIIGITLFVILFPVVVVPRYLFPSLLSLFPLAAGAAEYMTLWEKKSRFLTAGIMVCTLAMVAGSFLYYLNNFYFFGASWLYMNNHLPECELGGPWPGEYSNMSYRCRGMEKLNSVAQPSERVFISAEHYYWLRPDLALCANSVDDGLDVSSKQALWKSMALRGFRYILIDDAYPYEFRSADFSSLPAGVQAEKIFSENTLSVFSVNYTADYPKAAVSCEKDDRNRWKLVPVE